MNITPSKGETYESFIARLKRIFPKGSTVHFFVTGKTDGRYHVAYFRVRRGQILKTSKALHQAFEYPIDEHECLLVETPYGPPTFMAKLLYGKATDLVVVRI